jgi:hypothetical protein
MTIGTRLEMWWFYRRLNASLTYTRVLVDIFTAFERHITSRQERIRKMIREREALVANRGKRRR